MRIRPGPRPPLTPANWPGWLAVAVIWLLGKFPRAAALAVVRPLSVLMRLAMKRRCRVAERNIERCFPELDPAGREAILRGCFRSLTRAVFETAWSWSASARRIRRFGHVEGLEHLQAAGRSGRGVLLVTAHMTCLEIGARLLALQVPLAAIYRPLDNAVLEWYQNRSRLAYGKGVISKREVRSAIKWLRQGGVLWYAPDQDFGSRYTLFAPFFGIQTATLLATHRIARRTGCAVLPMFPVYDERRRHYVVHLLPALDSFPGADAAAGLARINALMESHIRSVPEQYWWIHRRFKTRPRGEAPFYE